jgi:hypothetical protein
LRQWDVVTTADCRVSGDECVFVVLDDEEAAAEHGPLEAIECARRALEGLVEPPYRAVAVHRGGNVWAVGAVAIRVARLPDGPARDELSLTVTPEGERRLVADGRPALADTTALESLVAGRFDAYVLRAHRLRADTWEVAIDPL